MRPTVPIADAAHKDLAAARLRAATDVAPVLAGEPPISPANERAIAHRAPAR
jgi:hypothetical protein